ncbi:LysE family translocator [Zoogloeaceae bacterium G21618-S1]|uniref:LysE family translocator n=1 Tax=Denitromonas halophila TaxID=1629404 RepID=A0A557R168_9RHOO|nr:LysE family translocator [Denitromonas halophila]MCZ4303984.1 LysE family translocator [Zoogloeaceae bacterium G21618-S1]TVO58909.1 LysE family translocator [Denitromonas halophila]
MSVESALTFFVAIFIFAITPGPGVFALLARALVSGARDCVALALGMTISDILYLIFACLGLAAIAKNWGELFTVIRFTGAAYLIYLGVGMWRAPIDDGFAPQVVKRVSAVGSLVQGFLISASNPKVILFYIAFLPTFMDLTVLTVRDIALAAVLTLAALMLGLMLIATMASRARRYFRSATAMRRLNRGAGSIMVGAGAFLAAKS